MNGRALRVRALRARTLSGRALRGRTLSGRVLRAWAGIQSTEVRSGVRSKARSRVRQGLRQAGFLRRGLLPPRVQHSLMLARAWAADYAYVGYWQVHGFLFRKDPSAYLAPSGVAQGTAQRSPVILIPGVYENWQFLRPLAEALSDRGHAVHTVAPLGYNRGRIDRMAALVQDYLVQQDLHGAVVVAHSKGGLIGKALMLLPEGSRRVDRMVAVNTPFSGSAYASFFLVPSIRAFAPRNKVLRRLMDSCDVNARITSVYSRFDPHIPGGSFLPGARNIPLETMGHFRPIGDPRLISVLARELELEREFERDGDGDGDGEGEDGDGGTDGTGI